MWHWYMVCKEGYEYIGMEPGKVGEYVLFRRGDGRMVILSVGLGSGGLDGYLYSVSYRRRIDVVTWRGQYLLEGGKSNGGKVSGRRDWGSCIGGGASEVCLFRSLRGHEDDEDDGIYMRVQMREGDRYVDI
jgi:hypothetical protein